MKITLSGMRILKDGTMTATVVIPEGQELEYLRIRKSSNVELNEMIDVRVPEHSDRLQRLWERIRPIIEDWEGHPTAKEEVANIEKEE